MKPSICCPLAPRDVENLLHERCLMASHATARAWWQVFWPMFAVEIRRNGMGTLRASRWRWPLAEASLRVNGVPHCLWRAVDHKGEVLETFVSTTLDRKAALRILRKLMTRHRAPPTRRPTSFAPMVRP